MQIAHDAGRVKLEYLESGLIGLNAVCERCATPRTESNSLAGISDVVRAVVAEIYPGTGCCRRVAQRVLHVDAAKFIRFRHGRA